MFSCDLIHKVFNELISRCVPASLACPTPAPCGFVFLQKQETLALFSAILYECVTQENPEMLPTYIAIDQERLRRPEGQGLLLSSEFLPVMKCSADNTLDRWLCDHGSVLEAYMSGQPCPQDADTSMLACFLVYHSIPTAGKMADTATEGRGSFPELLLRFSQLGVPVRSLLRLAPLLLRTDPETSSPLATPGL
ncbi:hypothetical protein JZ751_014467 [Albula glossodonta]|uniref:Anaphase-promoting complex subunit 1 C-terminal domain-containing protein n=1 Tax=Albula glossodonta TaxID=121402 RepID=A0A8T2MYP6_9TELE|nr:hypothetical protein JZ751_014467 [Albula glossodonta]